MLKKIKIHKITIIAIIIIVSSITSTYLELEPPVILFIRFIGMLVIPAFLGFGWKYILSEFNSPSTILNYWSILSQITVLVTNLSRIRFNYWGLFGWFTILLTITILAIYLTKLVYNRVWSFFTGVLILTNIIISYLVLFTPVYHLNPSMIESPGIEGLSALGTLLTDITTLGTFSSAVPQIYFLEFIRKKQERELEEKLMKMEVGDVWKSLKEGYGS